MLNFIKNHYKDSETKKTIANFKKIIANNGYSIEIKINKNYCFYNTEIIEKNVGFKTYGKGITENLAVASGLGEFIERMSFGVLASYPFFYYSMNDKHNERMKFYDLEDNLIEISRLDLFRKFRSTGMSAGNSYEETFVQGMSEIFERYIESEMLKENIKGIGYTCDYFLENNISNLNWLKSCNYILKKKNIDVYIVDFFSGSKLPVVAIVFKNSLENVYAFRFASHPILSVAVERCFTELFQLNSIDNIFKYMGIKVFDKKNKEFDNYFNIMTNGRGVLPLSNFMEVRTSQHPDLNVFCEEDKKISNEFFMKYYELLIKRNGWKTYIRKVLHENACTIQIIIPGISDFYADSRTCIEKKVEISNLVSKYVLKECDSNYFVNEIKDLLQSMKINVYDCDFYRQIGINSESDFRELYNWVINMKHDFYEPEVIEVNEKIKQQMIRYLIPLDDSKRFKDEFFKEEWIFKNDQYLNY